MRKSGNQKLKNLRAIAVLLMIVLLVTGALNCDSCFAAKAKTGSKKAKKQHVTVVKEPEILNGSAIVMSGSTSEIIYSVHADRKLSPGNITKLMTAMVFVDKLHDEGEYANEVSIRKDVAEYGEDFKVDDSVSVEDLVKAMLVGGSDEAAEAIARYSCGSRKEFVAEMNSKAIAMGLQSTHFVNPSGQYSSQQYSTATECAIIMQTAIRYGLIKELLAMDSVNVKIIGKNDTRSKSFGSTDPLLTGKTGQRYRYIKGGIAGTMKDGAISQYAGVSTIGQMQFVVVLLDENEKELAKDAINLFDYGNYRATKHQIINEDKCVGKARVRGGAKTRVKVYTETKGFAYIPPEGNTDLVQTETVIFKDLQAPLKAGTKAGEFRIYVADELKGTVDLVIKDDVKTGWLLSKIYISNLATVIAIVLILLVVYLRLRIKARKRRIAENHERRRQAKIREMAEQRNALDRDRARRKWTYSNYYDSKDINDALKKKK